MRSALGSDAPGWWFNSSRRSTAMAGAASVMCLGRAGFRTAQIAALPRSTYVHGDVHGDVPACLPATRGTSGEKLCRLPCSHTYHARRIANGSVFDGLSDVSVAVSDCEDERDCLLRTLRISHWPLMERGVGPRYTA